MYLLREHPGWQVIHKWLEDRAFHSWVDPRDCKDKDDWHWKELNLFHSADVAKQILSDMESLIAQAEYLRKKERGEIELSKFEKLWKKVKGENNV